MLLQIDSKEATILKLQVKFVYLVLKAILSKLSNDLFWGFINNICWIPVVLGTY